MSISTIHDNLYSTVSTLFSTKTELRDPYNIAGNPDPFLRDGYGITWETGELNEELVGPCAYVEQRNVGIVLTKIVARLDTNTSARRTAEKALLVDRSSLVNQIKQNPPVLNAAEFFEFVSDEGIQSVVDEKQNIIYLKMNFTIRFQAIVS